MVNLQEPAPYPLELQTSWQEEDTIIVVVVVEVVVVVVEVVEVEVVDVEESVVEVNVDDVVVVVSPPPHSTRCDTKQLAKLTSLLP